MSSRSKLKHVEEGDKEVKEMEEEIVKCNVMASITKSRFYLLELTSLGQLLSLRRERLKSLEQASSSQPSPDVKHGCLNLLQYSTQCEEFFMKLDQTQRLQNHVSPAIAWKSLKLRAYVQLDTLKKNAEDRRISSRTPARYHGIVDWAEVSHSTTTRVPLTPASLCRELLGLTKISYKQLHK